MKYINAIFKIKLKCSNILINDSVAKCNGSKLISPTATPRCQLYVPSFINFVLFAPPQDLIKISSPRLLIFGGLFFDHSQNCLRINFIKTFQQNISYIFFACADVTLKAKQNETAERWFPDH